METAAPSSGVNCGDTNDEDEKIITAVAALTCTDPADDERRQLTQNGAADDEESYIKETSQLMLFCDLGYGVPKESRPRKEKILAIARQLINFLEWQHSVPLNSDNQKQQLALAKIILVDCNDDTVQAALLDRMKELWNQSSTSHDIALPFPINLVFSDQSLDSFHNKLSDSLIYLSPDAPTALDPLQPPPRGVIIGMLIDRRVQVDRSLTRSKHLKIKSVRWPTIQNLELDESEPFNVDCILEGMQQWQWNHESNSDNCFQRAATQAWNHHQARHPQRPKHNK